MPSIPEEPMEPLICGSESEATSARGANALASCPAVGVGSPQAPLKETGTGKLKVPTIECDGPGEGGEDNRWLRSSVRQLALSGSQDLLRTLDLGGTKEVRLIVGELESHVQELLRSRTGNLVLEKLVEVAPPASMGFLIEGLRRRCLAVAQHPAGSSMLQRLFQFCSSKQVGPVATELLDSVVVLASHRYGSFVVQRMLEYCDDKLRRQVMEKLLPKVPALATHPSGNRVVQAAIEFGRSNDQLLAMLPAVGTSGFHELTRSRYGRYVAQLLSESVGA